MTGTTHVDSVAITGLESITAIPLGGAGGEAQLPGTYEFGDHREPYREAGMTGTLVVHPRCTPVAGLDALRADDPACRPATVPTPVPPPVLNTAPVTTSPTSGSSGGSALWPWVAGGAAAAAIAVGLAVVVPRRRRGRPPPT
jgi:hypothetical protein